MHSDSISILKTYSFMAVYFVDRTQNVIFSGRGAWVQWESHNKDCGLGPAQVPKKLEYFASLQWLSWSWSEVKLEPY